ncbi:MAG: ABC transporter permease, partial [Gammaproteobacteria bacterium]|nr:ABC transporter permease [Gammaproteobacteria bacterium]
VVAEADGIGRVTLRIETGPNEYTNIDLYAFSDFADIRLNKLELDSGQWPPPDHEILLERTTLTLIEDGEIGDTLIIKTSSDKRREVKVAGLVQDFTQMPAQAEGRAYGYITLDTLEWLDEPRSLNQLSFIVTGDKFDKAHIWDVAAQVEDKIEKSGRSTEPPVVPDPGEYPVLDAFIALVIMLGTLSSLSLLGGGFLTINIINGILTQQKRQLGMMKAIGAQTGQITGIYLNLVFILSLLSLLVGL